VCFEFGFIKIAIQVCNMSRILSRREVLDAGECPLNLMKIQVHLEKDKKHQEQLVFVHRSIPGIFTN